MMFAGKNRIRFCLALTVLALGAAGCETATEDVQAPARILYVEGESLENQGLYSEAITKFTQVTTQYPGTRLATFSYLKLGDILSKQEDWVEAETQYRLFLALNANSHFTPFLLYRLLKVNHERSYTGIIFKAREVDRDMGPNRQIILEFKRFFLLYPKSAYLEEVRPIFRDARETLAQHELVVGDFYFERGQYNAAAGRYLYLLRNYPEFKGSRRVVRRLIEAYRQNQQPAFADEIERIVAGSPDGFISPGEQNGTKHRPPVASADPSPTAAPARP
jgi:outer membrane protein assembly factor BamD